MPTRSSRTRSAPFRATLLALVVLASTATAAPVEPQQLPSALRMVEAEFRDAIRRVAPATVACIPRGVPRETAGFSSGVIISSTGLVLSDGDAGLVTRTAGRREVKAWRDEIEVRLRLEGGRQRVYRARVIHRDRSADTSLLQIQRPSAVALPYVELGRSDDVRVGEFAFALGTAFDEAGRAPPTTTSGLIASMDDAPPGAPSGRYAYLYVSAAVNQGVNGGPLVDVEGRLIGTVSTFVEPEPSAEHQFLGKAIPIDRLRAVHAGVAAARSVFGVAARPRRTSSSSTARALETAFGTAARRAHPAVVSLVPDRAKPLSEAVPTRETGARVSRYRGPFSGVSVSPEGFIVTALYNLTNVGVLVEPLWEVPAGAGLEEGLRAIRGLRACYADGVETSARVVGTDRRLGVALLQADLQAARRGGAPYRAPVLEAAPPSGYEPGRFVLAVGNPFGRARRREPLLTAGILSRLHPDRAAAAWRGQWQTDAGGLDSNAGGAAVDVEGRLLGLLTIWHPARHGRNSGVAFVVPWPRIRSALPDLVAGRGPEPGFLGVSFRGGRAARIGEVIPGSAAEAAALRVGDVIRRVDDEPVHSVADVIAVVAYRCRGDRVVVEIARDAEVLTIPVVLGARPPASR